MSWTDTNAFTEYILTQVHAEGTLLEGAYRPEKDDIEITPGGIVVPVFVSGTVEDVSTSASTHTPSNVLRTLVDKNKRRVDHFTKSQWNRFIDSKSYRKGIAMNQANDLIGQALTDFYKEIVDEGTKIAHSGAPSGADITLTLLTQIAKIKSRSPRGIPSKMTIFLNESGAAVFANDQAGKFNYAPVTEPFYGTWMGAKIWTTNDALSGSGTVYGGVFGELGIAYAAAEVELASTGEAADPRTGMRIVTSLYTYALERLDSELLYWLTYA